LKKGSFGCSYTWEARSPMVVVGADEKDMSVVVNRVAELNGGIVISVDGTIQAELALPLAGFLTSEPVEEVAKKLRHIKKTLKELGCPLSNPYLSIQTLVGTFLPYFRITQKGLVDSKEKKMVDLFAG
jgi:adenine deaminase